MSVLKLENIKKSYDQVEVLKNINFSIEVGDVIGFIGANGAGKSTLMKIIAGFHQPSAGKIYWNNKEVVLSDSNAARHLGITIIPQELGLIGDLTGAENIFIPDQKFSFKFIDKKEMSRRARELIKPFGIEVDLDIPVKNLASGPQQMVAIARALALKSELLILDEPTSMLTDSEVDVLKNLIRSLIERKLPIIYISHRLDEIKEITTKVVALRGGEIVGSLPTPKVSFDQMISWMIGNSDFIRTPELEHGKLTYHNTNQKKMIDIKNIKNHFLKDISFSINDSEILGIVGLVGGGRSEVLRALSGIDVIQSGSVKLNGEEMIHYDHVTDFEKFGVYLSPEDRRRQGLFLDQTIGFNCLVKNYESHSSRGFFMHKSLDTSFQEILEKISVKSFGHFQKAKTLSGGNQQRLILGRILARNFSLLLLDEVTSGVDVMTKSAIVSLIQEVKSSGKSILFVSSDWSEVLAVSDRVLIMDDGHLIGTYDASEVDTQKCMKLISEFKIRKVA